MGTRTMMKLIGRIHCLFGEHTYKPLDMEFKNRATIEGNGIYEIDANCIYCGHRYDGLVQIPLPFAEKLEQQARGMRADK